MDKKPQSTFKKRLKEFIDINIWVQTVRIKSYKGWYYVDLSFRILSRISPLINTIIYGLIINDAVQIVLTKDSSLRSIPLMVGGLFVFRVFESLLGYFYWANNYWLGTYQLRIWTENSILTKLFKLNWEHIETPSTEKSINMTFSRSFDEIENLADMHIDVIAVVISVITAVSVAKISPFLIALLIVKNIPSALRRFSYLGANYQVSQKLMPLQIQASNIIGYFRDFKTLLEVKVSRAATALMYLRQKLLTAVKTERRGLTRKFQNSGIAINIVDQIINFGVYIYYLREMLFAGMQIGTFQYTTNTIFNISDSIQRVLYRMTSMVDSYRYVKFAYSLLTLENKIPDGTEEFKGETVEIEFRKVSFKYPQSNRYALKDINLIIKDNDRLALVGENGAGKTTFLKLLMLIHYPTSGEILINGTPLGNYTRDSLYRIIALVTQDFARYDVLTVRQNISIYGDPEKSDMRKVKEAADLADAAGFIEKLPNKYESFLTKKLEGGTELSTGQWQRLAIARQFYANRPLIILDEPTASIDPIAEAKIFNNLYEHVKDKTVIVVSHRYNTVRAAKKILVFNDGQIIEQGNHAELLALNGYYAKAFGVQQEEKKL